MSDTPLKVHITGVYGLIGNLVYRHLQQQGGYELHGSGRRTMSSERADAQQRLQLPDTHFHLADLADADAIRDALAGADAVLHIGAVPDPTNSFDEVLESNIRGTYNVLEACRHHGIRRLVYASSVMASWGYIQHAEPYRLIRENRTAELPATWPRITHADPVRPTEPYSMSKVWAEGACRTYVDAHDLSVICLRIGWVNSQNAAKGHYENSIWCSHRDITSSFELALKKTAEASVFDICYAMSESEFRWVDLEHARQVTGFVPRDVGAA